MAATKQIFATKQQFENLFSKALSKVEQFQRYIPNVMTFQSEIWFFAVNK